MLTSTVQWRTKGSKSRKLPSKPPLQVPDINNEQSKYFKKIFRKDILKNVIKKKRTGGERRDIQ